LFVAVSQKGEGNVYARVKFRKNVWGGEAEQRGGKGNGSSREGKVDGSKPPGRTTAIMTKHATTTTSVIRLSRSTRDG